jgi:hypothetical protein
MNRRLFGGTPSDLSKTPAGELGTSGSLVWFAPPSSGGREAPAESWTRTAPGRSVPKSREERIRGSLFREQFG